MAKNVKVVKSSVTGKFVDKSKAKTDKEHTVTQTIVRNKISEKDLQKLKQLQAKHYKEMLDYIDSLQKKIC